MFIVSPFVLPLSMFNAPATVLPPIEDRQQLASSLGTHQRARDYLIFFLLTSSDIQNEQVFNVRSYTSPILPASPSSPTTLHSDTCWSRVSYVASYYSRCLVGQSRLTTPEYLLPRGAIIMTWERGIAANTRDCRRWWTGLLRNTVEEGGLGDSSRVLARKLHQSVECFVVQRVLLIYLYLLFFL